ncbi:kinase-like domain-containing protein [Jimgerdemannia flammicorona]|uniref:Kinase-like domain-containing protein n=1 Tax=Jimgerdemannia flammicorona TaxID=994334 RepID=A0A433QPQ7_9FUNG|nr:kinase-like domain-containing protein [Jimgerdemannia flammicorona]
MSNNDANTTLMDTNTTSTGNYADDAVEHISLKLADLPTLFPTLDLDKPLHDRLKGAVPSIGEWIVQNLSKTWEIIKQSDIPNGFIVTLAEANFNDKYLPFTKSRLERVEGFTPEFIDEFFEAQAVYLAVLNKKRFHLCGRVRRGSFGSVHQVQERSNFYASKVIAKTDDNEAILYRELRMLNIVPSSPHLVQLRASYEQEGNMVYIMNPWASLDLKEFIERQDKFEFWKSGKINKTAGGMLVGWMGCIASGLAMLHANNIKHRDLKPANVLLLVKSLTNVRPVLCDYGLSKHFHAESSSVIQTGTMFYQSPERVRGKVVGRSGDIFALGAIFAELAVVISGESKRHLNGILVRKGYAECLPRGLDKILALYPYDTEWWMQFRQLISRFARG